MRLIVAHTPEEIRAARDLFLEYAASIGHDLCFQGFHEEVAGLPGDYSPPAGRLLLAMTGDDRVGCVAVRPLEGGFCEMKRLYVRPAARGLGAGKALAEGACAAAAELGYRAIRLDTLPSMTAAIELYRSLGFRPIAQYCDNPVPGAMYFELDLAAAP